MSTGVCGVRPFKKPSGFSGYVAVMVSPAQRVPRTGWVYRNVAKPESVSDHMYRMAMMALVTEDKSLNKDR